MKYLILISALFLLQGLFSFSSGEEKPSINISSRREGLSQAVIYSTMNLKDCGLSYNAFTYALKGMDRLSEQGRIRNSSIISIIDLSQSSNRKRLYIIDLDKQQVIFQTYVAHGRNSGEEFAHTFSNQPSSFMTSLGFYSTGDLYTGEHGLSLRLFGEEAGINNKAYERAIVMHGADYVKEDFIKQHGRLGRSQGCPAVPAEQSDAIVNLLKSGTCLFLYYPDQKYLSESTWLN